MSTATTATETIPLTEALAAEGWTYTREVHTDRQWRSRTHELDSPDGRLRLDASVFPDGSIIARLSAEAVRTGGEHQPGWMTDLHEVPLPVALAAVTAAAEPAADEVATALTRRGWHQRADVTEYDGRLLEHAWDAPDGTRSVSWSPADAFDLGGWTVTRPGPTGRSADTQASQYTPAAVIATLALTD